MSSWHFLSKLNLAIADIYNLPPFEVIRESRPLFILYFVLNSLSPPFAASRSTIFCALRFCHCTVRNQSPFSKVTMFTPTHSPGGFLLKALTCCIRVPGRYSISISYSWTAIHHLAIRETRSRFSGAALTATQSVTTLQLTPFRYTLKLLIDSTTAKVSSS